MSARLDLAAVERRIKQRATSTASMYIAGQTKLLQHVDVLEADTTMMSELVLEVLRLRAASSVLRGKLEL